MSEQLTLDNKNVKSNKTYNSFLDDQFMLDAMDKYERIEQPKPKRDFPEIVPTKVLTEQNQFNSTVVSDDILQMCQLLEKNTVNSSKETIGNQNRGRRSVHFRNLFGDDYDNNSQDEKKENIPEKGKINNKIKYFNKFKFL